ncbi:MAG: DNA primase [Phycisphaerales bacterium]|nr:DNA primase [Phycisphaerales bacterium]
MLDATDIVRLIGDHLTLKPKGREYVGLCPFHNDRKPSMYVVPAKGIFHCFACGAGGNAFDFVMRYHGMDFREALKFLAEKAGVELTPWRPAGPGGVQPAGPEAGGAGVGKAELLEANQFACDFFRAVLNHPEHGRLGRDLVARRGLSPDMVEAFGIGVAPDRWDGLLQTLGAKGRAIEPFVAAGLLKAREGGGHYDALRNRLIFTIHDQLGRPIAFGGRRVNDEDEPKYLNSPETLLFNKSSTLFGLHRAFRAMQAKRQAIVCEGYVDAISCHQHGFAHAVATLGTALTPRHASILRRSCDEVVLLFDGDEAGQTAADRALEVFFLEPIDVKVCVLPDGLDPDDLLRQEGGPERFAACLERAQDALSYRFERLARRLDESGKGETSAARARMLEEYLARLVELGLHDLPPLRKQLMLRRVARLARVDERVIAASLPERRAPARPAADAATAPEANGAPDGPDLTSGYGPGVSFTPKSPAEHALACLLAEPKLIAEFPEDSRDVVDECAYDSPRISGVAEHVAMLVAGSVPMPSGSILHSFEDSASRQAATAFASEIDRITEGKPERIRQHWSACVREVRRVQQLRERESSTPSDAGEVSRRLASLTAQHQQLGGNRRTLPKPNPRASGP